MLAHRVHSLMLMLGLLQYHLSFILGWVLYISHMYIYTNVLTVVNKLIPPPLNS